jgi:hypothetical protein
LRQECSLVLLLRLLMSEQSGLLLLLELRLQQQHLVLMRQAKLQLLLLLLLLGSADCSYLLAQAGCPVVTCAACAAGAETFCCCGIHCCIAEVQPAYGSCCCC